MGKPQEIEVQDSAGKKLGSVERHIQSSLWRATGKAPKVWLGGQLFQSFLRGRDREAQLVVKLPAGAPLPKELGAGNG